MTHHRRVAIWLLRPPTPDVLVHPIRRREPGTLRGCRLALSVPCGKSILSTSLVQVIYAHSLSPFQTLGASSYPLSVGLVTLPCKSLPNSSIAVSVSIIFSSGVW